MLVKLRKFHSSFYYFLKTSSFLVAVFSLLIFVEGCVFKKPIDSANIIGFIYGLSLFIWTIKREKKLKNTNFINLFKNTNNLIITFSSLIFLLLSFLFLYVYEEMIPRWMIIGLFAGFGAMLGVMIVRLTGGVVVARSDEENVKQKPDGDGT
jgi:hypothetical protein